MLLCCYLLFSTCGVVVVHIDGWIAYTYAILCVSVGQSFLYIVVGTLKKVVYLGS